MLRKLLKYEFAATGRYLLPLLCLLLVMAAAAGLSIRILSAGQAGRAAAARWCSLSTASTGTCCAARAISCTPCR